MNAMGVWQREKRGVAKWIIMKVLFLIAVMIIASSSDGYTFKAPTKAQKISKISHFHGKKDYLGKAGGILLGLCLLSTPPVQAANLKANECVMGVGSGCETAAEGNSYIAELQRKSAERKVSV